MPFNVRVNFGPIEFTNASNSAGFSVIHSNANRLTIIGIGLLILTDCSPEVAVISGNIQYRLYVTCF